MKLIDTHCHITDSKYKDDFENIIDNIKEKLDFVINVGYDLKTSEKSVELSKKYECIYAAVGIHPNDADTYNTLVGETIEKLALENKKVIAIGEIGLDYYRDYVSREVQQKVFRKQLEIAERVKKPVVIHCRDSYKDTVDILNEYKNVKGIMHSYSGSYETAMELLDRFYFSISGPITFPNADKLREMVSKIPLEKLLVETDSPYLTPVPFRGQRNQPDYVEYVAKKIAEIKNMKYEEFVKISNENTRKAFSIK